MPKPSRFENSYVRRLVLAVVMVGLLAVSTVAAMVMTAARNPKIDLTPRTETIGRFELTRPGHWQAEPADSFSDPDLDHLTVLAAFREQGRDERHIAIVEADYEHMIGLIDAYHEVRSVASASEVYRVRTLSAGLMAGVMGESIRIDRQGMLTEKIVAAVMTLDGRRVVGVVLVGDMPLKLEDVQLVRQIAESARDTGYELVDSAKLTVGQIRLNLPEGLIHLRHDGASCIMSHVKSAPWVLWPTTVDLADDTADTTAQRAYERLLSIMAGRYRQRFDRMPAAEAIRPIQLNDRPGCRLRLTDADEPNVYEELLGVVLSPTTGLIVRVESGVSAGRVAIQAAQIVAAGAELSADGADDDAKP